METKRIITGFIIAVAFAGLIVCPALARKYDTMMVGPDRWIDTEYLDVHCELTNKNVFHEGSNKKPEENAFHERGDEPDIVTYDGQMEPNTITLIYYPDEYPEHPNDIDLEDQTEPNMVNMFYKPDEHPEEPNGIDYEEDIDPNQVLIYVSAEHPEEPNKISAEEEIDPNEIEKIILDEGTANLKSAEPDIAKSS